MKTDPARWFIRMAGVAITAFSSLLQAAPTAPGIIRYGGDIQWVERQLSGRDDTVPREASAPYPTLINLSLEWLIEGDDNLNGAVSVSYRDFPNGGWKPAMPLRRVPGGVFKDSRAGKSFHAWANMHAGSIIDLTPDTEYEIVLRLHDPDGGSAERILRARTRPVPRAMTGARVVKVTAKTFRDEAGQAEPGDILLLAPGNYGFFHAPRDGAPGRPIVFRADPHDLRERHLRAGDRQGHREFVLFDGFSFAGRKHVYLEGVLSTDTIDLFNAEDCAVMRCNVQALWGIISGWSEKLEGWAPQVAGRLDPMPNLARFVGRHESRLETPPYSRNCYIADNVIMGATPWSPDAIHAVGKNLGEGIEISGPGNVVCHNRVVGFRDCISLMEGAKVFEQTSVDIYNNDISAGADDGIEADYMGPNCRIVRNRITNSMRGIALAPVLGGPVYVIRNVLYNTEHVWQFSRVGTGYVALHNTSVKRGTALVLEPHLDAYVRNNLFIGGGAPARPIIRTAGAMLPGCDYDFNGYGAEGASFAGNLAGAAFDGIEALRMRTTMEKHGAEVGLDAFQEPVPMPADLFPEKLPVDFRLHAEAPAIDAGEPIPNMNDGFAGRAPDLGAHEFGANLPVYGPRPISP